MFVDVLAVCFLGLVMEYVLLAFATEKAIAFIAIPFTMLSFVVLSTVSSMKSDMVSEHIQGALQGAITGVKSVMMGIGPLLFLAIFALFRTDVLYFPGAAMLVIAFAQVLGLFFVHKVRSYRTGNGTVTEIEIQSLVNYKPLSVSAEEFSHS